jgi:hypothetical protein
MVINAIALHSDSAPLCTTFFSFFLFFFCPRLELAFPSVLYQTDQMGEKQPAVPQAVAQDDAVVYLEGHGDQIANVDLKALRRKIDRHLLPYMFCCYVLQFLDKVMLNVSARSTDPT